MLPIRSITPADIPALILVGARAFAPQALTIWIYGDGADAVQRGASWVEMELACAKPHNLAFTTPALQGLALWYPPGHKPNLWASPRLLLKLARSVKVDLRKVPAQLRLFNRLEKLHPRQPHYYLRLLAVDPASQASGIGTALMQPVLERCDHESMPAYLETDTDENIRFYQRRGFELKEEIPVGGTPYRMVTMWRPQRV